jgi:homoserine kinase
VNIEIEVPASSANLGVGFDCLALALDIHLGVRVEIAEGSASSLVVEGEGSDRLSVDPSNRFLAGFSAGWRAASSDAEPALDIVMTNEIPLGRGLGSSAAATVAGLMAAEALAGIELGRGELLRLAAEIEGHADNAAAALFGGFVIVADGRVVRFDPPALLRCVLFVPVRELATNDMRAALPAEVAHADATHNAGAVALLVAAFATGDLALFSAMNDDRLHEPYRSHVFPELPSLKKAALEAGALGAALSGAGSSVLALVDADTTEVVASALQVAAARLGLAGSARVASPAAQGAIGGLRR